MRKLFFALLAFSITCFSSCSDGDIIEVELEFGDEFSALKCGTSDLVFYKTKNDPSESLSIVIKSLTLDDILGFTEKDTLITKTGNVFNYRTYSNASISGSNLFCNNIPPSDIVIVNDYESTGTEAVITATLTEDDNDGIPAALEDINGNGDLEDDDTDGDGLPNYIDADDDGDNVLTKDENPDPNGDGNLDDAQNTDGEGLPDYLEPDDDGDGVDTRDEETESQDKNPTNDITNSDVGPDYLNPDVANTNTPATAYRTHTIARNYEVTMKLEKIGLEIISIDEYDFGELTDSNISSSLKSRTVTPEFN